MIIRQDQRPNKMIWVTFRKEGMHRYPAAATDPALATGDEYDVSFLANEHRHIFHFRVWIGVTHNDRDIEFIQFKRWLENLYKDAILSLDHKSCEMMSDDLYDSINKKYPGREIWIEVSEDGENGSFIKY
jgi:frataxin-like iron-binding protein CyaY